MSHVTVTQRRGEVVEVGKGVGWGGEWARTAVWFLVL